jgi:hypothetical protein
LNTNIHYQLHKRPQLGPILNQFNPIHTLTLYFLKIHLNIVHVHLGLPSGLSLQVFHLEFCMHFSPLLCVLRAKYILIEAKVTSFSPILTCFNLPGSMDSSKTEEVFTRTSRSKYKTIHKITGISWSQHFMCIQVCLNKNNWKYNWQKQKYWLNYATPNE